MKRTVTFVAPLIIVSSVFIFAYSLQQPTRRERKTIILRVTSSNPQEQVEFAASYLFRTKESPLINVEQKTPFEVKAESNFVAGIFRKKSGNSALQVDISIALDGQEEEKQAGGGGDIVIIDTQPERNHRIFAQALSQR